MTPIPTFGHNFAANLTVAWNFRAMGNKRAAIDGHPDTAPFRPQTFVLKLKDHVDPAACSDAQQKDGGKDPGDNSFFGSLFHGR